MKKGIFFVVATAFVLTACTNGRLVIESNWLNRVFARKPTSVNPLVYVDVPTAGSPPVVVVDQEPIRIRVKPDDGGVQKVVILFSLETTGYIFVIADASNPLNLKPAKGAAYAIPAAKCNLLSGDSTQMLCNYVPLLQQARYTYTIQVQDTSSNM